MREAPGGEPLAFRLVALNEYPEDISAAKMMVGWCRDVGIKLKLDLMDEGAFTDQFYDNADYDLFIWSWGGDIDPGFMLSTYTTTQIMNNSMNQYSNPEYDRSSTRLRPSILQPRRQEQATGDRVPDAGDHQSRLSRLRALVQRQSRGYADHR